jgi:hypothetical protein
VTAMSERRRPAEESTKSVRAAHAFFIAHLANLVGDLSALTDGDENFDYFVPVALTDLHTIGQQIADLEYTVKERFGIDVTALPIPIGR